MKMTERQPELYIEDILNSVKLIEEYTKDMSNWQELKDNQMAFDAVVRNFEIIGEAVRQLVMIHKINEIKIYEGGADIEAPWPQIIGMRNRIAHEYFGIDVGIIWKTIQDDLPLFKKYVLNIKDNLSK